MARMTSFTVTAKYFIYEDLQIYFIITKEKVKWYVAMINGYKKSIINIHRQSFFSKQFPTINISRAPQSHKRLKVKFKSEIMSTYSQEMLFIHRRYDENYIQCVCMIVKY